MSEKGEKKSCRKSKKGKSVGERRKEKLRRGKKKKAAKKVAESEGGIF